MRSVTILLVNGASSLVVVDRNRRGNFRTKDGTRKILYRLYVMNFLGRVSKTTYTLSLMSSPSWKTLLGTGHFHFTTYSLGEKIGDPSLRCLVRCSEESPRHSPWLGVYECHHNRGIMWTGKGQSKKCWGWGVKNFSEEALFERRSRIGSRMKNPP